MKQPIHQAAAREANVVDEGAREGAERVEVAAETPALLDVNGMFAPPAPFLLLSLIS